MGIYIVWAIGDTILLSGSFGNLSTTGVYSSWGNIGIVSFDNIPLSASWAQVIGASATSVIYLTGIFWSQTTGWATFSDVGAWPVTITPPASWANIRESWYLSGYAWSENAGWIKMNHDETYASGVVFIPDSPSLSGYAWSDTLGWISFGSGSISIAPGFIGKISVGWNLTSNKSYSVLYDIGTTTNSSTLWSALNGIRKNISYILRNAWIKINNNFGGSSPVDWNNIMVFKMENNPSSTYLTYSTIQTPFDNSLDRSLIVIGGDIYIDTDVISPILMKQTRAIIAQKNDLWQWGNIWIAGSVKKIEANLVAEKTIWSGDDVVSPGSLSPYFITKKSVFLDLPKNQLYIHGSTASYNTIGWSSKDGWAVCPVFTKNDEPCDYNTAIPYDWNYFRTYDRTNPRRAYPDSSKDAYSVIIEYDSRTLQDPPPWLSTER